MKRFNICSDYGLVWNGFNVKIGMAFGRDTDNKLWVCPCVYPSYAIDRRLPMYRQNERSEWHLHYEKSHTTRFIIDLCQRKNINVESIKHYKNPCTTRMMRTIKPYHRAPKYDYTFKVSSQRVIDKGQLGQDDFFGMDGYNGWAGYH